MKIKSLKHCKARLYVSLRYFSVHISFGLVSDLFEKCVIAGLRTRDLQHGKLEKISMSYFLLRCELLCNVLMSKDMIVINIAYLSIIRVP